MKKLMEIKKRRNLKELLAIMAKLRSSSGCPWDREQTEDTLKPYLLEEAYEAIEAIETGRPEDLKDELGDLLLQIIFISQISSEKGQFEFPDVVHTLAEKLIRRHPHIFPPPGTKKGMVQAQNAQDVKNIWKAVKRAEGKYAAPGSLLSRLPLALPALEKAERIAKRVSRVGFDWPNITAVWEKVEEELTELEEAAESHSKAEMEKELGDLFLALVNWGRFQGISAEEAVRKANRRFMDRFHRVEVKLKKRGRTPETSNLAEMDRLWNEAKNDRRRKANGARGRMKRRDGRGRREKPQRSQR
jgi:MazG family protein